MRLFLVYFLCT